MRFHEGFGLVGSCNLCHAYDMTEAPSRLMQVVGRPADETCKPKTAWNSENMRQEESCYWLRLRDEGNFGQQWLRQERLATALSLIRQDILTC